MRATPQATPQALLSEQITFGSSDEAIEAYHARGWTDGLPIIPPTEQKVRAMIAGSGRPADSVVGVVPPRWAEATVELLAVNAVMAGCVPEHMPVLVAAVEAACDPAFGLYSIQATTHPCGVLMVVTGPVTKALGMNWGHGAFGPGNRANAALGRALRLALINVGGAIPGRGDMSTHGSPGKYTYCVAENEQATPWEPLRVALGFSEADSTVSVFGAESPHNVNDHLCTNGQTILGTIASVMATAGSNNATNLTGDVLIVLGPEHAHSIAADGMTRKDVQMFLFEQGRNTIAKLKNRLIRGMAMWPRWINQADETTTVPLVGRPEDILVMVAGGSGKHSCFIPTFGVTRSVTRKIVLTGAKAALPGA